MNLTRDRVRSIGWAFVLTVCLALTAVLTLRVNAVKGQVHEAETRIVSLKRDIIFLETEFQTRANQQQLKALNDVEFGYVAPRAAQYIEGERQLAALGKPRGPGAPSPIRVASAIGETGATPFMAMVSPVTGKAKSSAGPDTTIKARSAKVRESGSAHDGRNEDVIATAIAASGYGDQLSRIELSRAKKE